jgi:serine/threonine protein kinase/Tol biopolymer transport system component
MALTSGTRLGPYEIVSPLGAGGMGEVYRAKDTRLERTVAIKILPAQFSSDPVRKQRFEREAKTISSLNHPHICVLYDVGSQDGVDYLVMECVEGETLSKRLEKGPLPLEQVLRYGAQLADALGKAHRNGVIHRDLKPGNIMLTSNGAKLLDFGLAKPSAALLSELTLTAQIPASPVTQEGTIIGTFQYMSPEQVEGKELDARSDIFSLGAILYEMLSGRKAFEGRSQLSVASAILEREPTPINSIKPMTPPVLEHVVKKCLAKSVEERWQSAGDLASELKWIADTSAQDRADDSSSPAAKFGRQRIAGIAALTALAATVLLLTFFLMKKGSSLGNGELGFVRLNIILPPKQELAADVTQAVALSPDGKRIAYVAAESGVPHLYVRRLDQFAPIAIPDSEGAWFPFFSPNGDWVAFFNQGKLKKASADGGVPVVICELTSFFGGTWTPQDVIAVSVPNYGMATVSAKGGSLHKVPTKEPIYPQGLTWLAGGDWVAFTDYFSPRQSIMAVKLSSGEMRQLLDNAANPSYAAGHLVYYQGGAMWAVPFDPEKLAVLGNPSEIEAGVNEENYLAQASASRNGVLAYAPGLAGNFARNVFLVNRQGQEKKLDLPPKDYIDPAFSPDGKRISLVIRSVQQLEVLDRDKGTVTSLAPTFGNFAAEWTSDGKSLLFDAITRSEEKTFATDAFQQRGIYRIAADGASAPEFIRTTPQITHITSIAGDYAAAMVNDPATNTDLWLLSMHPPYEMRPFKRTPAIERQGTLSPDGHWMAYASNESGRSEIYVEPVPGPGGRRQISSEGGDQPRWVRNGREITYRNGTKMMSVSVQLQPALHTDKPTELFNRKFDPGAAVAGYDVTPDGQTFVMTRSEHDNPTEIRVVLGWPGNQKP